MKLGSKLISFLIISLLILAMLPIAPLPSVAGDLLDTSALRNHSTIHITDDSEFSMANGVLSGDGSIKHPYLIANWTIDATNNHGIWIEDTDAYFVISNCLIYNGTNQSSFNDGIHLKNSKNGTIINNLLRDINYGIYIRDQNFLNRYNIISPSNLINGDRPIL